MFFTYCIFLFAWSGGDKRKTDRAGSFLVLWNQRLLLYAGCFGTFSGCMGKVPFMGEWSYSHYPDNYVNYNGELLKRDEFLIEYAKCWERVKNGIEEAVLPELQLLAASEGLDL